MEKEILELKQIAVYTLTDEQYIKFAKTLDLGAMDHARYILADILEELEVESFFKDEEEGYDDIIAVQKLDSLLTEIILNQHDEDEDRRRRKKQRRIRGAIPSE